ncbi:reverse transcriptase domain-containing protein [Tanacetum coccineum]
MHEEDIPKTTLRARYGHIELELSLSKEEHEVHLKLVLELLKKEKLFANFSKWIELFSDYDCKIRYHPRKANVVADAFSRKERVKPRRVRAMSMTIRSSITDKILAAQGEASKDGIPLIGDVRTLIMDKTHASRNFEFDESSIAGKVVHLGKCSAFGEMKGLAPIYGSEGYAYPILDEIMDRRGTPTQCDVYLDRKGTPTQCDEFMDQRAEFPQLDSDLAVPLFLPGDDPIASLNKAMAFLTNTITSCFPTTNNQLKTSSNPRNQATIQDGRVIVQQVQGRQGQSFAGMGSKSIATSSVINRNGGNKVVVQARVVRCYNCQGEGHMERQCTQPKRPRNSDVSLRGCNLCFKF